MIENPLHLGRSSSLSVALRVAGVLSGMFWLTVLLQAFSWLDGERLLAVNLLVLVGLAFVVGYETTRSIHAGQETATLRGWGKTVAWQALAVPILYLCIGIVVHVITFELLLDSGQYTVYYPIAIARWLMFLAAAWIVVLFAVATIELVVIRTREVTQT